MNFSLPSLTLFSSLLNQFEVLLHSPSAFAGGGLYSSLFFALLFFAAAGFLALAVLGGSLLPESGASPSLYGHYMLSALVAFPCPQVSAPVIPSTESQRTILAAVGVATPAPADVPHLGWSLLILLLLSLAKASLDMALEGLRAGTSHSWLTALAPESAVADPPPPFSPALDCCEGLLASGRVPLEFFWGLLGAGRHGFFTPPSPLTWGTMALPELLWQLLAGAAFPWHAFYALLLGGGVISVARLLGSGGEASAEYSFSSLFRWRMPSGISFFNPGDFFTLTLRAAGEPGTAPLRQTMTRKPQRGWALKVGQRPNRVSYHKSGLLAPNQVVVKPREIPILLNNKMTKGHFGWQPPVHPNSPYFGRLFEPRFLEQARQVQRGHWESFQRKRSGWAGFFYGDGGSCLSKGVFSLNFTADRRDWKLLKDLTVELGLEEGALFFRAPGAKHPTHEGNWRVNITNRPQVAFVLKVLGPLVHPSEKRIKFNLLHQRLLGKPLPDLSWLRLEPKGLPTPYMLGSIVADGHISLSLRESGKLHAIRISISAAKKADLLLFQEQLNGGGVSPKWKEKPAKGHRWQITSQSKVKRIAQACLEPGQPSGAKFSLCLAQAPTLIDLSNEGAFRSDHPRHGEWQECLRRWGSYASAVKDQAPVGAGDWVVERKLIAPHSEKQPNYPLANYAVIRPTPSGIVWNRLRGLTSTELSEVVSPSYSNLKKRLSKWQGLFCGILFLFNKNFVFLVLKYSLDV